MITVAVAARQPQSQKRYRALLGQAGVGAHFVTDVGLLIKCVKSRPIDLVIFDLDDRRWPARKWLEAAKLDSDLGLVPVVWIGSEMSESDLQAVDEHRPGLHLAKFPDAKTLTQAMESLVGSVRRDDEANPSASQRLNSPTWKPAADTIDDALRIFADSSNEKKPAQHPDDLPLQAGSRLAAAPNPKKVSGVTGKDAGEDYDWFVAEMIKTETTPSQPQSDSGFIEVVGPSGTEKGILLSKPNEEDTEGRAPDLEAADEAGVRLPMLDGLTTTDQSSAPPVCQTAASQISGASPPDSALVDRIAKEVTARLAGEILKNFDKAAIRRAVEAALTRPQ